MVESAAVRKAQIAFGAQVLQVDDPLNISYVAADVVTEVRLIENTLSVSLGTIIVDGNGTPTVRVCSRLRFRLELLSDIQRSVDKMLKAAKAQKKNAN